MLPFSFAEAPGGLLMAASGFDPMYYWDGIAAAMTPVGLAAPATAPGMILNAAGMGSPGTSFSYTAYVRFLDALGNLSNLSPISVGSTGTITNATNANPIVITSPNHGLPNNEKITITGVGGNTNANGTFQISFIDGNTFSIPVAGNGAYTSGGTWTTNLSFTSNVANPLVTPTYTNVPLATDSVTGSKVVRRQILRNTNGQSATYYVEIDTTDLTSTSFTSAGFTDQALAQQTAVPILDTSGGPLANQYGVPPNWKTVLAAHLSRMFLTVERTYSDGGCKVAVGSKTVTGVGTAWTASLAGRYLYVQGAVNSYQIASVNVAAQTLTLVGLYTDSTDNFATYSIRPAPAERKLLYFSGAGLPQAWLATNSLSIQEDGDEITGLMPKGSFLYILEKRHIYRLTYQNNPATDGFIFLTAYRGCVNQRCFVVVEDIAYMLDEQGIHAFSGGQQSEPISTLIQDLFRFSDSPLRINWRASAFFHASHFPQQEVIRWFVCMSGHYLPRHAICYNYRQKRWWIEEFAVPIGASATGILNGQPQVFLGSDNRRALAMWNGTLDGPDATAGKVRGTITSATLDSFTDALATFPPAGLVDNPVSIVAGTGKGQQRIIRSVSGQTVYLTQNWLILPDTTSVYQLGGVQWRWQSGWFRWTLDEEMVERRVAVTFQTLIQPASMVIRIFIDFSANPVVWSHNQSSLDGNNVASVVGSADLTVDMTKPSGYAQVRLPGRKELYIDGARFVSVQLSGVSNADAQKIYYVTVDGAFI